jgi:hypothetical protein
MNMMRRKKLKNSTSSTELASLKMADLSHIFTGIM